MYRCLAVLFSACFLGLANPTAVGAEIVATKAVLQRVLLLTGVEEGQDHQILSIHIDTVTKGKKTTKRVDLAKGASYGVHAVGDEERIQDLDLTVYSPSGKMVGKDTDATNLATVSFRADEAGAYRLEISAYAMSKNDGFYGLVISRTSSGTDGIHSAPRAVARELPLGARVSRGPDWKWGDQGGNTVGTVIEDLDSDRWVRVKWDNGDKNKYRWGGGGAYDLTLLSPAPLDQFRAGQAIRIRRDAKDAMHGNWASDMDEMVGRILTVREVTTTGVRVWNADKSKSWYFTPDAVELIP